MPQDIRTTIAVAVTVKVDIEGKFGSPDALLGYATLKAMNQIEGANIEDLSVEGATAFVNRSAIEEMFA